MTDGEALLKAIIDSPDDDTPRLVYADWLDEQGEHDRAQFIRVHCRLANLAPNEKDNGLRLQAEQLLARHKDEWAGPVRGLVRSYSFRRGFVDWVDVEARAFLDRPDELFRSAPIRYASIRTTHDELVAVAGSPHLTRLRRLSFSRIGDRGAELLALSPYLGGLEVLELFGCDIGPSGAEALAVSPHLSGLKWLRLGHSEVGDDGLLALAGSGTFTRLQHLDVISAGITARGLGALATSPLVAGLDCLVLSSNPVGPDGAAALADSPQLREGGRLSDLILYCCHIGDAGAGSIAAAPWIRTLRKLELAGNDIGRAGAEALWTSPYLSGLLELGLTHNRLTEEDGSALRRRFGPVVDL